jgi:ribosomal protein L16 Arg81 hydroxylase
MGASCIDPAVAEAVLEAEIGPGDLLFLPVGWWHFVGSQSASMTFTLNNFLLNNDFLEHSPADHSF